MRYHDITKNDMKNGDGLRVVLWVSGCEHHCPGCHNPITWNPDDGIVFDDAAKQEIFKELEHTYCSGITFTGGDPLHPHNRDAVYDIIKEIKQKFPGKTIWIYTGYRWEDVRYLRAVRESDVLVDGKFEEDNKDSTLMWKGSSNQRVIDIQRSYHDGAPVLHCEDHYQQPPFHTDMKGPCCCS